MNWLFRDPLRGWFSFDKFPYERAEGELELDFMIKSVVYLSFLLGGSLLFVEGGFLIYLLWGIVNGFRRKS